MTAGQTSADTAVALATSKLQAAAAPTVDLDHESVAAANGAGDLWSRIRTGFQLPDFDNDLVQTQVDWYATRPDYVQRMTDRSRLYLYHIVQELERRHMPTELALLPFIESAYNPQALSVAKAAGMWQFVPGTGRTYNLKQNMFQDERRDVLASTSAALDYLQNLHDMFGDWYLALAAYNWGEGNVQRAIARNTAQGLPTDYADLRLPNETRNYVPKLQAVKDIIENPAKYGLTLPLIPNHPYFITVTTARDIDVKVAAQLSDLSLDQFKALNPSFTKPVILGATSPQILLPFENAETFEHNLKSYTLPLSSWTTYTVSQRERPAALAAKIGVDPDTLVSVNKIPAGMRLKAGSTVLVPKVEGEADEDISADVAESAVLSMEPDIPDTRKMLVRVRKRETVVALAQRYGVSVAQVRSWNKMRGNLFAPGARVILHVPVDKTYADDDVPRAMPLGTVRVASGRANLSHGGARVLRVADPVPAPASRADQKRSAPVASDRKTGGKRSAAVASGKKDPGKRSVSASSSRKPAVDASSSKKPTAAASSSRKPTTDASVSKKPVPGAGATKKADDPHAARKSPAVTAKRDAPHRDVVPKKTAEVSSRKKA